MDAIFLALWIGVLLFERRTRAVVLTPAGQQLLDLAEVVGPVGRDRSHFG